MQTHIIQENKRVVILLKAESRREKGERFSVFVQFLNPRLFSHCCLRETRRRANQEWYFQRYIEHFPAPGEMVFFDRSWYNRAVIRRKQVL